MVNCDVATVHNCVLPPRLYRADPPVKNSFLFHDDMPKPSSLALSRATKWPGNGVHLDVACINHPPLPDKTLEEIVKLMNNAWSSVCNCRFILLPFDLSGHNEHIAAADVRIRFSFHNNDSWSYVGTQILERTDRQQPTMSIGVPGDHINLSDPDFITKLLHETGHTLGFMHEHLRPELVERIDKKKAIAYYKVNFGWTKEQTKYEVLSPLLPMSAYDFTNKLDIHSIMCYDIPHHILKDGSEVIPGGRDLSEYDKKHAAAVYPIPNYEKKVMKKGEVDMSTIASKNLYLLTRNGAVVGHLEVDRQLRERIIIPIPVPVTQAAITLASDGQLRVVKNGPANATRQEDFKGHIGNSQWKQALSKAADVEWITSTRTHHYCQTNGGEIYQISLGKPNSRWRRVDKFNDTVQITANWRRLYQLRKNGEIWVYRGVGEYWTRVHRNRGSEQYRIEAYEDRLFRIEERRKGSSVWVNSDDTETGWKLLRIGKNWSKFTYTGGYVYKSAMERMLDLSRKEVITRYTGIC